MDTRRESYATTDFGQPPARLRLRRASSPPGGPQPELDPTLPAWTLHAGVGRSSEFAMVATGGPRKAVHDPTWSAARLAGTTVLWAFVGFVLSSLVLVIGVRMQPALRVSSLPPPSPVVLPSGSAGLGLAPVTPAPPVVSAVASSAAPRLSVAPETRSSAPARARRPAAPSRLPRR